MHCRAGMASFLDDGRIEIDSNVVKCSAADVE